MRITKNRTQHKAAESMRIIANRGCDVCPICGETKTLGQYISKESIVLKGISGGTHKTKVKGIFNTHVMHADCYHCLTCGAEWESEWYYVN